MSDNITPPKRYKEAEDAYKNTLYRSAFAIRSELKAGLQQVVELSGAPSVSGMLALMSEDPEGCAALLKPIFETLEANRAPRLRRRHKVTMKAVMDQMREGLVSPEEMAAALEQVKKTKTQAGE